MKKSLSVIVGALAVLGAFDATAATNFGTRAGSSVDLTSAPATRERQKVNYEKYQTRTYTKTYEQSDGGDLYYAKPSNRSALYKQYDSAKSSAATSSKTTVRKSRSETVIGKLKRKYYLAHPFFQPLGGKFGSVTDVSYSMNSYDIDVSGLDFPLSGELSTNQFAIKEDFSFGITDRLAVLGMFRYDSSEYKAEWDDNESPDDKMENDGVNLFGLGAQWRFVDNDEWIATLSGYYQHQKDISNNFILDLKAGYKVASSTIYGLARGWYIDLEGNSYGHYIEGETNLGTSGAMYLPYAIDDSAVYIEGGIGVFSVLNEDWTLNLEAVYGDYDWHNQASIKGAIGWQPNDWFALNLYVKTAFFDNAEGKKLDYYVQEDNVILGDGSDLSMLTPLGKAEVDNYSETSVGVQAIFQF